MKRWAVICLAVLGLVPLAGCEQHDGGKQKQKQGHERPAQKQQQQQKS